MKTNSSQLSLMRYIAICLALLLLFSAFAPPVAGQSSPITVTVNKKQYTTDELVVLSVTLVDNSPQQLRPNLPPLDGLAIINFDIATNVSTVNGKIQTEVVYTYQLQPRRTGQLTIPPITVEIDGEILSAAAIDIEIIQGLPPAPSPGNAVPAPNVAPPPGLKGQDFFAEATLNSANPYLGQQVIYTFRFYQAIKLYQPPQFEMPIFNNFDTIGLPIQEYNLDINGRTYLISEINTVLFPKTSGTVTIGPGRLMIPGNFFEEPIELFTGPTTLQVKNLPDNAPPGFSGAVGQYQIEAWFSPQVAVVNQPATFSVAISGVGNMHTLPQPIWPNLNNWRTYDSSGNVSVEMKEGQLNGTRVYERVIVSDTVGDFTIPPTKLVYFDPIAAEYQTISTKSLSGRIIPAPTPNAATATAIAVLAQSTPTPASIANSFGTPESTGPRPVIQISSDSVNSTLGWVLPISIVLFWALCGAIPVATMVGAGGFWLWQRRQQQAVKATETLQQPGQKMHPVLARALTKTGGDNYKAVNLALQSYFNEMLSMSVKGLTQTELSHRLQERGLPNSVVKRVRDCLAESEMGRFGPSTGDAGWDLLAKTDELIIDLDEIFKA